MNTLNDIYKTLSPSEKDYLMEAFDNLVPRYLTLANNRFLGVHCGDDPDLNVEESVNGYWFIGTLKNAQTSSTVEG
jgi:hypothetical protein